MPINTYRSEDKLKRLSEHYTVGDLWLNPAHTVIKLDDRLIAGLEAVWKRFGKPVFGSANALYALSGTHASGSLHYTGQAADFSVAGIEPYRLAQCAETLGMGGVGVYKDTTRHIHMDTRSGCARWWVVTTNSHTPGFGGVPCAFRQGDRSPAVKEIQAYLNKAGYACGAADGVFGPKTAAALKAWQRDNGLAADGVYGRGSNGKAGLFEW